MKNQYKKQDEILNDLFRRHEVFEPSSSFTDRVMYRVSLEKKYNPEIYRPLISRTAWIFIGIFTAALVFMAVYFGDSSAGWIDKIFNMNPEIQYPDIDLSGLLQGFTGFFAATSPVIIYTISGMLGMIILFLAEQMFPRRPLSGK